MTNFISFPFIFIFSSSFFLSFFPRSLFNFILDLLVLFFFLLYSLLIFIIYLFIYQPTYLILSLLYNFSFGIKPFVSCCLNVFPRRHFCSVQDSSLFQVAFSHSTLKTFPLFYIFSLSTTPPPISNHHCSLLTPPSSLFSLFFSCHHSAKLVFPVFPFPSHRSYSFLPPFIAGFRSLLLLWSEALSLHKRFCRDSLFSSLFFPLSLSFFYPLSLSFHLFFCL